MTESFPADEPTEQQLADWNEHYDHKDDYDESGDIGEPPPIEVDVTEETVIEWRAAAPVSVEYMQAILDDIRNRLLRHDKQIALSVTTETVADEFNPRRPTTYVTFRVSKEIRIQSSII